jgi:DNA-binding response OmpR family regulator
MPDQKSLSVLIVEDNERLRNELAIFLREDGFYVNAVGDSSELNVALESEVPSILILDLNLPGEDGISICKRIRESLPQIGIIILSARVRASERNEGYNSGADVFLTKPTNTDELISVINNLSKRLHFTSTTSLWTLDTELNKINTPDSISINLTSTETLLLKEFVLHGRYISHDDLFHYLGNPDETDEVNKSKIEVLISRLRKKIGQHFDPNLFIKVIRGKGYQLSVPIQFINIAPSGKKLR